MSKIEKIKLWWKRTTCNHLNADLLRWHWTHGPNGHDPATVESEYKCQNCGKIVYLHLDRKESFEWAKSMGDYKKA